MGREISQKGIFFHSIIYYSISLLLSFYSITNKIEINIKAHLMAEVSVCLGGNTYVSMYLKFL
jgi:hypothetical protein